MSCSDPGSRWLWITPEIRDDQSTGALVYSMGLARAVVAAGIDVTMVGVGGGEDCPEGVTCELIAGDLRGGWRSLASPLPNLAYATRLDAFVERVEALLQEPWDVVVVDGLQVAWATEMASASAKRAVVFVAHNHEASLRQHVAEEAPWHNGKRFVLLLDAWKAARLERRSAELADVVTSITDEDRERFAEGAPETAHVTLTPGWSAQSDQVAPPPLSTRPRRVGILGSLDWHVKQDNLRRFLNAADGILAAGGVELLVGGRCPDGFRAEIEATSDATTFAGWIDDPSDFLGSCRMGVIAEPLGGGFKLKSLDYVFNGVPLACLQGNAAGLPVRDGYSMIEAPTLEGLAQRIVAEIDQVDELAAIADAASDVCGPVFSWERRALELLDVVDEACRDGGPG
ncbi:MAG: glycosyltransferase [Ilumatobacter sp.]